MRIESIEIQNFLGARDVRVEFMKPVMIVAGANGAGKSSIADAVSLVLTANLGRVTMKKHAANLITDSGARNALVSVRADDVDHTVTISAAGKIEDSDKGNSMDEALRYVLDASLFARVDAEERRTFLFDLMDVRKDAAGVRDRLLNRRHKPEHVDQVIPLLRAGFPAACTEAQNKAREAKGAWKAITGEPYGDKKADGWRAEIPHSTVDQAERTKLLKIEIATAEENLQSLTAEMGGLQQQAGAAKRSTDHVAQLREQAAKYARIADKLERDRAELADWNTKVADLERTQAVDTAPTCACPECGAVLDILDGKTLRTSLPRPKVDPTGYPAAIATAKDARDLMASAVANGERDLATAERAAQELKRLEDAGLDKAPDQAKVDELGAAIGTLRARIAALRGDLEEAQTIARAAADAGKKTEQAAKHHAEALAWSAIADSLDSNGIPAELLADALGPFNARLLDSCDLTGWPGVQVQPDMSITYGGRALGLCSESERWRADAVLTEAVSRCSHLQTMILDRMDVLDVPARGELLGWLDTLTEDSELNSCLVLATLKAAPTKLPKTMAGVWIEAGVCATERAKEAA